MSSRLKQSTVFDYDEFKRVPQLVTKMYDIINEDQKTIQHYISHNEFLEKTMKTMLAHIDRLETENFKLTEQLYVIELF